mgnify:CR=1 FL=1
MNFQIHFVAIIINHLHNFLSDPLCFRIIYTIFKFYLCFLNFLICDRIPFIIKISYDCICISSFLPSKYIIFLVVSKSKTRLILKFSFFHSSFNFSLCFLYASYSLTIITEETPIINKISIIKIILVFSSTTYLFISIIK